MSKLVRGAVLAVFKVHFAASANDISKDEADRCEHLRGPVLGTNGGAGSAEGV